MSPGATVLLSSFLTAGGSVCAADSPQTLEGLQQQLSGMLSGWDGDYAVAVNGSRQQVSASTIKIYIAMAVAQAIESGAI